jgi:hypothetical protein
MACLSILWTPPIFNFTVVGKETEATSSCQCYFLIELIGLIIGPLGVVICLFCHISYNYDDD